MSDFLLEIGTEEIPAGYLEPAVSALERLFRELFEGSETRTAYSLRRLVLFASGLPLKGEDSVERVRGPRSRIAFKDGKPTKAGEGFARSQGVPVGEIIVEGEYCYAEKVIPARSTREILAEELPRIIVSLPFPKTMQWGTGVSFARPIRWVVAILDDEVVEFEVGGVRSGRETRGHRFLSPEAFELRTPSFEEYRQELKSRFVIVDPEERREFLRERVSALLAKYCAELEDEELLVENANMVEYPNAVEGEFEERFLRVPADVIVTAMKHHQYYFPVRVGSELLPRFVACVDRAEPSDKVREGHERVLKARLADSEFFWEEDKKVPLESLVPRLASILYQNRLGNYLDRTQRLRRLAVEVGKMMGFERGKLELADRSAELCKADLLTQMVGEFPELQGVMGGEYARIQGEPEEVAQAIRQHYLPRSARDPLPESEIGVALSLADKLDAVVGCMAVGTVPTGSEDPYALRRHTLGILRLILEKELKLSLSRLAEKALMGLPQGMRERQVMGKVLEFFGERLYHILLDRGYEYDIIQGALHSGFDDVLDLVKRVDALSELSRSTIWTDLVITVERTHNITKGVEVKGKPEEKLFETPEEEELWKLYREHSGEIHKLIDSGSYIEVSKVYCKVFAEPVHRFFDRVFVNVENAEVRLNRMKLLRTINLLYSEKVADLSEVRREN